jgi:hypothetical protein
MQGSALVFVAVAAACGGNTSFFDAGVDGGTTPDSGFVDSGLTFADVQPINAVIVPPTPK